MRITSPLGGRRGGGVARSDDPLTRFHGEFGMAGPLAPGAFVEPATPEAGHLQREKVVAGAHARSAVGDHMLPGLDAEPRVPRPQLRGRQEPAVRSQVLLPVGAERPGNVTGPWINRLGLTAKALPGASVEQDVVGAQR